MFGLGALFGAMIGGEQANQGAAATVEGTEQDLYFKNLALDEQQRQYDLNQGLMKPFYESGRNALISSEANSQNFGGRLNDIMQMPQVQEMVERNTRGQQNQLRSMGMGRSGVGQLQLGGIASDTAMSFENMLNNRLQSLAKQAQTGGIGLNTANQSNINNQSNIYSSMGNSAAQGAMMRGNYNQANINNQFQQGANALGGV